MLDMQPRSSLGFRHTTFLHIYFKVQLVSSLYRELLLLILLTLEEQEHTHCFGELDLPCESIFPRITFSFWRDYAFCKLTASLTFLTWKETQQWTVLTMTKGSRAFSFSV